MMVQCRLRKPAAVLGCAIATFHEHTMSGPRPPGFDTLALHAGAGTQRAHSATTVLEERVAALEGGVAAIATASGQAALHLAVATLAGAGDHVVASRALPAAARDLLAHALARFGLATSFVDPRDLDAWRAAIRPATRLLVGAALGGDELAVLDIPAVAALAHAHHLPLLVDATLATPHLQRPFDLGADILLHGAGHLGGHGSEHGGLLVDGGTFDWQAAHAHGRRFATLCEPHPALDGRVCGDESTVGAFALAARLAGLPAFGGAMSPHEAGAILHGLDTLGLRMARHIANARHVAAFLSSHPVVARLAWPELDGHPDRELARRILPRGCGATLAFGLDGIAVAARFVEALRVIGQGDGGGGARTTLRRRSPDATGGIGWILSIGLEDPDDLVDDLRRGLKLARTGA